MTDKIVGQPAWALAYAKFVLRFRIPIMLMVLVATIAAATQIYKLDIRNDPDTLLPPTNRYVATNLYGEHKFGMGNLMVWGMRVKEGDIYQDWFINMVQEFHAEVTALPHANVPNFIDLASQKIKYMGVGPDGSLEFKRLIPVSGIDTVDKVKGQAQLDYLRKGLEINPAMGPMLLHFEDKDGNKCDFDQHEGCTTKATFIIGDYSDEVKAIYLPWVRDVRAIADKYNDKYGDRVEFMTAGEPYFLAYMLMDLVDKAWLFLISIGIVIGVLWFEFRNGRGAAFPLLGVGSTICLTLGVMGFTEFKLTTMMVLTPMLLLAIGIGHSVQVTRRFMQEREKTTDDLTAAELAIAATIIPATLSIVTDMVGFATLSLVDISFYKAYAYFGMFGMMTLLITTTTLIPLLFVTFPPKKQQVQKEHVWEHNVGSFLSRLITGPGKWIPIAFVFIALAVSTHYTKIIEGVQNVASGKNTEFDIMPGVEKGINYSRAAFKESSITIQDLENLGKIMPGVISVNIPVRGVVQNKPDCGEDAYNDDGDRLKHDCYDADEDPTQGIFNDADVMKSIEDFEEWMREHPYIGFTGSYIQFVKLVNMLLTSPLGEDPDKSLFHIPVVEHMKANWDAYKDPEDPEYVPEPNELIEMYNGLLEANTSAGDLDSFVDTVTWNEGIIMGFVNTMDPVKTHVLVKDIQNYLEEHRNDPGFKKMKVGLNNGDTAYIDHGDYIEEFRVEGDPSITSPAVGGFLGATEATRDVAMSEWLKSPLTTALAIFIISMLMFRSIVVPGILVLMLLITLFTQYGMGGYFTSVQNWSGNLAFHTQVALSIAMGLGVDYGIYMFSRLREEMIATGNDWQTSLNNTLSSTGSAVIVSVVVLLGSFVPLLNTEMANTWALGIYISEALIIDVVTALTILPLMVYWLKPKFVFTNK